MVRFTSGHKLRNHSISPETLTSLYTRITVPYCPSTHGLNPETDDPNGNCTRKAMPPSFWIECLYSMVLALLSNLGKRKAIAYVYDQTWVQVPSHEPSCACTPSNP